MTSFGGATENLVGASKKFEDIENILNNFPSVEELRQAAEDFSKAENSPELWAEQAAEALGGRARLSSTLAEERDGLRRAAEYLELALAIRRKKKLPFLETALKLAAHYLSLEVRFNDQEAVRLGRDLLESTAPDYPDEPLLLFWLSHFQYVSGKLTEARELYDRAQLLSRDQPTPPPRCGCHRHPSSIDELVEPWPAAANLNRRARSFRQSSERVACGPGPNLTPADFRALTGLSRAGGLSDGDNPYRRVSPETGFWKTAVVGRHPKFLADFYQPRFPINSATKIMSAGSCFAQHIGRLLKTGGFAFLDYEPGFKTPHYFTSPPGQDLGYDLYSARYGNIYTARQLRQLFQRAFGLFQPREPFWENEGRYYDAFRPTVEPEGFYSPAEAEASLARHLEAVRRLFSQAEVLIFTLGLTEAWLDTRDGSVYPLCPGTKGGTFDPAKYAFKNFNHEEVVADLEGFFQEAHQVNPGLKVLLTVSPVPLTATAGGGHVLTATMRSKAVLRAAADTVYARHDFVDYFPAYDIICSTPFSLHAFEGNMRTVKPEVVNYVMTRFFQGHGYKVNWPQAQPPSPTRPQAVTRSAADELCDEALLEAYAQ